MSRCGAEMVQEELKYMGPLGTKDIAEVQHLVFTIVQKLNLGL